VPQESLLAFPETLPDNWIKVRDGVVRPWMVAAIEGQGPQELEKTLEDWQKAQKK
jgi:hypothetical protein